MNKNQKLAIWKVWIYNRHKNNVLGHCTVFSLKTAKIIIWKKNFTEIWPVWMYKVKKVFSNKYCDLLVHARFTKFTGPAKVFLKKGLWKKMWFLIWWSLQRGQLNKSPCRCKKKCYKIQKKITNSIKLDLPSCPLIPLI